MKRSIFTAAVAIGLGAFVFGADAVRKPDAPATKPGNIAGVPEGWELVKRADYTASQTPGDVTLVARGQHPTAGYQTMLAPSLLRIWPPQYLLIRKKPDGSAAQVMTPFEVSVTFKAKDLVKTVIVTDAAGQHEVKVDQARD